MSVDEGKYLDYSAEDFVWDNEFRSWVNAPDEKTVRFWENWLLQNPHKVGTINTARQMVQSLVVQTHQVGEAEIVAQIDEIIRKRDAGETAAEATKTYRLRTIVLLRIAAILILILSTTVLFLIRNTSSRNLRIIATASGIQKRVTLSDSSTVILNSNSKLSFKKKWGSAEVRELWMEGEGFFEVKHLDRDKKIADHERFLVHVNGLTVEVLGTSFNIRNRRNKTEVVLKEGSIKLSFDGQRQPAILMQPEEIVTIDTRKTNAVLIAKVKSDDYVAWVHQKLILDNTRLSDIIQYLEDNYGKKIILSDTALKSKRINGTLLLDNLDDALFILSKVLKVKVEQNDSSIHIIKM